MPRNTDPKPETPTAPETPTSPEPPAWPAGLPTFDELRVGSLPAMVPAELRPTDQNVIKRFSRLINTKAIDDARTMVTQYVDGTPVDHAFVLAELDADIEAAHLVVVALSTAREVIAAAHARSEVVTDTFSLRNGKAGTGRLIRRFAP